MKKRFLLLAAGLFVMNLGTAHALVLANGSPAQKLRKDVAKQLSKYTLCLIKALQKCEATGVNSGGECFLNPVGAIPPADPKIKFAASVALCESKVLLSKKSPSLGLDPIADYQSIGCPGDSNSVDAGDQPYTDLNAYQTGSLASVKSTIGLNALLIDAVGCAPGINHTDPTDMACVTGEGAKIATLVKGLFKCGAKCENDYSDSHGNGGTTDVAVCADGGAVDSQICIDLALTKATKKGPFDPEVLAMLLTPLLRPALTDAGNDIYNENDCP